MKSVVTALLCAAWSASGACADIVHFTNPAPGQAGHYDWRWEPVSGWESWLDITMPSTAQSNLTSPNSVGQVYVFDPKEDPPMNVTVGGAAVNRSFFAWGFFGTTSYASGNLIGFSGIFFSTVSTHVMEMEPGQVVTTFPDGARRYMGVRTGAGNYGWIEVERHGMNFRAYGWAYQAEPGVPITAGQAPSPGPAAMLALTACVRLSRRMP